MATKRRTLANNVPVKRAPKAQASKAPATLGDKVKDLVSGFTGIVTSVTTWLNGCRRVTVQPDTLNKDGQPKESQCFDVEQVRVVKAGAVVPMTPTGGPMPSPKRHRAPRRSP